MVVFKNYLKKVENRSLKIRISQPRHFNLHAVHCCTVMQCTAYLRTLNTHSSEFDHHGTPDNDVDSVTAEARLV